MELEMIIHTSSQLVLELTVEAFTVFTKKGCRCLFLPPAFISSELSTSASRPPRGGLLPEASWPALELTPDLAAPCPWSLKHLAVQNMQDAYSVSWVVTWWPSTASGRSSMSTMCADSNLEYFQYISKTASPLMHALANQQEADFN